MSEISTIKVLGVTGFAIATLIPAAILSVWTLGIPILIWYIVIAIIALVFVFLPANMPAIIKIPSAALWPVAFIFRIGTGWGFWEYEVKKTL